MNMDSKLVNVPVEEDVTIGTTSNGNGGATTTTVIGKSLETETKSPIATTIATQSETVDNLVEIDGIRYEIIRIDDNNDKQTNCDQNTAQDSPIAHVKSVDAETMKDVFGNIVDISSIPVLSQESLVPVQIHHND